LVDLFEKYLDSSKHTGKRMDEISSESDRMFVLSLSPAMTSLSIAQHKPFDENSDVLQVLNSSW